jgi:hypothetical protein
MVQPGTHQVGDRVGWLCGVCLYVYVCARVHAFMHTRACVCLYEAVARGVCVFSAPTANSSSDGNALPSILLGVGWASGP